MKMLRADPRFVRVTIQRLCRPGYWLATVASRGVFLRAVAFSLHSAEVAVQEALAQAWRLGMPGVSFNEPIFPHPFAALA